MSPPKNERRIFRNPVSWIATKTKPWLIPQTPTPWPSLRQPAASNPLDGPPWLCECSSVADDAGHPTPLIVRLGLPVLGVFPPWVCTQTPPQVLGFGAVFYSKGW